MKTTTLAPETAAALRELYPSYDPKTRSSIRAKYQEEIAGDRLRSTLTDRTCSNRLIASEVMFFEDLKDVARG